jgi:NTP pyrophosphatase (non-canonical NTP hydrolase)
MGKGVDEVTFEELEQRVAEWHDDRNLINGSSDAAQMHKLFEEVNELDQDVLDGYDLRDELGDCLVVLINIATRNGFTLKQALTVSYNKIKNRKGQMRQGIFVKEEDL